jgi:hypothetical protein
MGNIIFRSGRLTLAPISKSPISNRQIHNAGMSERQITKTTGMQLQ